ncbi:WD-repeat protein [Reticulomyxa filosa]|uniref:WD-repeat protein n=1 Tax=Reticulomyxa filosa TaxID=46433 RepID=X6MDN6_RETFI|nr:WD-repeat protein [Reticulomyxa filosa]|eukprot:ETO12133.1 WD-repeat protein [Reticulomyxa filosa]
MEAVNFGETCFLSISASGKLSPDGSKIISVDESFKIQDAISREVIIKKKKKNQPTVALLFVDNTIEIWDTSSGKKQSNFEIRGDVNDVQLSCDGNIIAVILSTAIEIWIGSEKKKILKGHTNNIHKVQFSSDGERILSCSSDITLMWDVKKGNILKTLKGHSGIVQFSSDGSKIAYLDNASIKIRDIETKNLKTLGHSTEVIGMQFSSDGSKLVSYSNKIIRLWDVISGNEIYQLAECYDIYEVQFSSGNSKIVTYSKDKNKCTYIRSWDMNYAKDRKKFKWTLSTRAHSFFANKGGRFGNLESKKVNNQIFENVQFKVCCLVVFFEIFVCLFFC